MLMLFLALAISAGCTPPDSTPPADRPDTLEIARRVALTFDDLPVISRVSRDIAFQRAVTDGILAALRKHNAPAIGFVNENKLERNGAADPARVALLQQWLDAGLELGNHSYSHPDLHRTPLEQYQRDVLRGEAVTRTLLEARGRTPEWFRHPFLHTGRSVAVRDSFDVFLKAHGYRVAPVTVDNYDYVFAAAYDQTMQRADTAAAARIADAYLAYMDTVFGFYEAQSRTLLGREIPQTLLLHANMLNAVTLDRLLTLLQGRGYDFVPIAEAMRDSAYQSADAYAGPAGITWLHRWALTRGVKGSVFAGEPVVPEWVTSRAQ